MRSPTFPRGEMADKAATPQKIDWIRLSPVLLALLAAIVLGASSRLPPLRILIVEGLANIALLIVVLRCGHSAVRPLAIVLATALLLVPASQLIPMPKPLWELGSISEHWHTVLGFAQGSGWRPLTLRYDATLQSLLSMQACVALFLAVTLLDARERRVVIGTVVAAAVLSTLLGIVQGQAATRAFYLLPDAVPGTLTGFFGNRNHHGDFLVMTAGLCSLFIGRERNALHNGIATLLCLLFAVMAAATESRSAIVLLAFAALGIAIIRLYTRPWLVLAALASLGAIAVASSFNPVVASALARFEVGGPKLDRLTIWTQSQVAIQQALPFGSGLGTFQDLYRSIEPLGLVSTVFVNQAHNDLLQLLAEAGIIGIAGLIAVLAAIGLQARTARTRKERVAVYTVLVCLCVPLLHSLVDYPLRTLAIGMLAAVLAGLLFPPPPASTDAVDGAGRTAFLTLARRWPITAPTLLFLVLSFVTNLGSHLTLAGRPDAALAIAPFSSEARLAVATQLIGTPAGTEEALRHASAVLERDALSSPALAIIGLARLQQGQLAEGDAAFLAAAHLGWRDPVVQQYVLARAVQTGSPTAAARAADALLRQAAPNEGAILDQLRALLGDKAFRSALVVQLADQPSWQDRLFARLRPASPAEARAQLDLFADLTAAGIPGETTGRLVSLYLANLPGPALDNLVGTWRLAHPGERPPTDGIVDAAFRHGNGNLAPFGWLADRKLDLASAGLRLHNDTNRKAVTISQFLALPPGIYELSYRLTGDPADRKLYRMQLRCWHGSPIALRGIRVDSGAGDTDVLRGTATIKSADCRVQRLALTADGAGTAFLSDLSITAR